MWLGIFKPNLVCKFFTKDHTCRFENNPFLYSWMFFFFLFRDLGLLSNRTGISAFEIWERLVAGIEAIKVVIQIEQKEQVWTQSYECVGVCVCAWYKDSDPQQLCARDGQNETDKLADNSRVEGTTESKHVNVDPWKVLRSTPQECFVLWRRFEEVVLGFMFLPLFFFFLLSSWPL